MIAETALQAEKQSPLENLSLTLAGEMKDVNALILSRMTSDVPMIPQIASYLIAAGGKRIRPLLTLACAALYGEKTNNPHKLAAAVEFIHTATLLHDDVVDGSDQRRGKPAANTVFGNQASILVGDFLFARAFELMVETDSLLALKSLSHAAAVITEGEVLQMSLIGKTDITRDQYFKVIEAKTAALFAASCDVVPMLSGQDPAPMRAYGYALGMAFQISDDVMDYVSPKMGKDKGDDFMEGKVTLPVIIAIENATSDDRDKIQTMIECPKKEKLNEFIVLLEKYDAFKRSIDLAQSYCDQAVQALESIDSTHRGTIRDDLMALPSSILSRVQ